MNTHTRVLIIGEIDGAPERKVVKEKDLAEFRVQDVGLRISAWEGRAKQVPDAGTVIVEGYLSTRTYMYGDPPTERTTTEIRATNIQVIESAADSDADPL